MINRRSKIKLILAIFWCLLTVSLVTWWWMWVVKTAPLSESMHRMITFEGSTLIAVLLIGGAVLITYIWQDDKKNHQVNHFFSLFTHDLKTSISRLRLQAEIIEEDISENSKSQLHRWMQDINRLDLQLENSLLFAQKNHSRTYIEKVKLSTLVGQIKNEFPELSLEITHNAFIQTDKTILTSLLRNTFQNSIRHGHADKVKIQIDKISNDKLKITICDNGLGYKGDIKNLGKSFYSSTPDGTHGLGLYLCVQLCKKIDTHIHFTTTSDKGFCTVITTPGQLIGESL